MKQGNLFKLTNEPLAHELWRALIDALTISEAKTYGELVFSALLARHLYGTFVGKQIEPTFKMPLQQRTRPLAPNTQGLFEQLSMRLKWLFK